MFEENVPEKLKHFNAQVAMDEQSSGALSHEFVLCGQQSMSSIAATAVISDDFAIAPAPPTAGRMATDRAIRSARMVRPIFMPAALAGENTSFSGDWVK